MELVILFLLGMFGVGGLYLGPRAIWMVRFPFLLLNRALWFLSNPLRGLFSNPDVSRSRGMYLLLLPLLVVYWAGIYLLLLPLRLIDAVYFDLLLFWSAGLRDGIVQVLSPQKGRLRHRRGLSYGFWWVVGLPIRLAKLVVSSPLVIFQGLAMFVVDCVWPSRTMVHGTRFEGVATDIVQTGRWYVGRGDYCGEGVYFGVKEQVAHHYAPADSPAIVLSRVTLTMCRPVASLPLSARRLLGQSGQSRYLALAVHWPWGSLEHWRKDRGWYEYCLPMPGKQGGYVSSWRIRPLCVLRNGAPTHIHKGLAFWPGTFGGWIVLGFSSMVLLIILGIISG